MPAKQHAGAASSGVPMVAALALLGLLGFLAATGQFALGATRSHATVGLRSTSVGKVLVAANGRTLYLFVHDKHGKSTCAGQCAKFWPPLIAAAKPTAGAGAKASLLGRTRRADGRMQVTYAGHPLYFFVKDAKSGEVEGEGIDHFGGLWWAVAANGHAVKPHSMTTTTEDTTTTNYVPGPVPGY